MNKAEKFFNILNASSDGLWIMDQNEQSEFFSDKFYQRFDIPIENSTFDDWLKLVHPLDVEQLALKAKAHKKDNNSERIVSRYRVKDKQGKYRWIEAVGVNVQQNKQSYMVGLHRDISDEVLVNEYLQHEASHDSITGLLNIRQFEKDMATIKPNQVVVTCCFDPITQNMARSRENVFQKQIVSSLILAFENVVSNDFELYKVSSNIFVAIVKNQGNVKLSLPDLIFNIDTSYTQLTKRKDLTGATKKGVFFSAVHANEFIEKNAIDYVMQISEFALFKKSDFSNSVEANYEFMQHNYVHENLVDAIPSGRITAELQPIVNKSGKIVSFEALARWHTEEFDYIPPLAFIPIAETLDLIHELGLSIVDSACSFLSAFDQINDLNPSVNINVSVKQLLNPEFSKELLATVLASKIEPSRIVLEITESHIIDDSEEIMSQIGLLSHLGFKISIDDFGSGFSSITSIYKLPLYQLKLDRALVYQAINSLACKEFIQYLAEFGSKHNIHIVAEGIEDKVVMDMMDSIGVNCFQGYYIDKPGKDSKWLKKMS